MLSIINYLNRIFRTMPLIRQKNIKQSFPERISNILNTIDSFGFLPNYLLTLSLCLKLTLDILIRNMRGLQDKLFLFSSINQARSFLYFYDNKLLKHSIQSFAIEITIVSIFCLFLLISIVFLYLNTQKNKNIFIWIARAIVFMNYILSSLIFGLCLNLMVRSLMMEQAYIMFIPLGLLILSFMCNLFLQIFMCSWTFQNSSILKKNFSKYGIMKFLLLRALQIYFCIRTGSQTFYQFSISSLLLLILDTFTLKNFFRQIYYYHEQIRKIFFQYLVIEFIFSLLTLANIFQIQLLHQNIIFGMIFGSLFMTLALQAYYNNFKSQISTKQLKDISNQSQAIMYVRFINELIQKSSKDQNSIIISGIISRHAMYCNNLQCLCNKFRGQSKLYSKSNDQLIKNFFSSLFKQLYKQFPNSPYLLVTWLNFSLQICQGYTLYLSQLKSFFLSKKTPTCWEKILYLQGVHTFEQFIYEINSKDNSIDTQTVFLIMEKSEKIKQQMLKTAHNFSERWRILCCSFCQLNTIEKIFDATLSNMKTMNKYWEFILIKNIQSIEIYTIFYLYNFLILNEPSQYKAIRKLIDNLTQYLSNIKSVDINNLRQLIFNENACNLQTPIDSDTIGIIENCTTNSEKVLRLTKHQLKGSNIKILMPATLAQCHDELLDNWIKTGTKRSIHKIKRVYGLRGKQYKQLFACDLYLKLYCNTQTHKLSFVVSIVLKNPSDYIIINPNMIVEGYGSKLKSIMPRNIIGQPFTQYNSTIAQLWFNANENKVYRTIIIRISEQNTNTIKLFKINFQISHYLMVSQKFLLMKIMSISKPKHIKADQLNTTPISTTMIVSRRRFSYTNDKIIMDQNQSICTSQNLQDGIDNSVKDINNHNGNHRSSVASSIDSIKYSFSKIKIFCLEKFYDSSKIKTNNLKMILISSILGIICCLALQWYQVDNSSNRLFHYRNIIQKVNKQNKFFILETILYNEILEIKQQYGNVSLQTLDELVLRANLIKLRINNHLSVEFLRINQNTLYKQGIDTYFEAPTLYNTKSIVVNTKFLHFTKLIQAAVQKFLHENITQQSIQQTVKQLNENQQYIIQLLLSVSQKSFVDLFDQILVDRIKMYVYGVVIILLLLILVIFIIWHSYKIYQRKVRLLLINEIIPYQYSDARRQYYRQIKQLFKEGRVEDLICLENQQGLENLTSTTMANIEHQKQRIPIFLLICSFLLLILAPQVAILEQGAQVFNQQEQFGHMIRKLQKISQIVYATYTTAHYQIVTRNKSTKLDELLPIFTEAKKTINQNLEQLYLRYNTLRIAKAKQIETLVTQNLCQFLEPILNKKELQMCRNLNKNYTLISKGIFASINQFLNYAQQKILNVKNSKQPDIYNNQDLQAATYFVFLGIQRLNSIASQDISKYLRNQFEDIIRLVIIHIFVCVVVIGLWVIKSIGQIKTYRNIFGYAMLFPLELIKANKVAFRMFEQTVLTSF